MSRKKPEKKPAKLFLFHASYGEIFELRLNRGEYYCKQIDRNGPISQRTVNMAHEIRKFAEIDELQHQFEREIFNMKNYFKNFREAKGKVKKLRAELDELKQKHPEAFI